MPDSQQPYPGCEWYQPIAFSNRPTCVPGYRSTYQHRAVLSTKRFAYFLRLLDVLDHVLVRLVRRIDARLRALNGKGERVHDYDGVSNNLPLHEPHDFPWYTRACVDDLNAIGVQLACACQGTFIMHHFYQCNRRDFTRLEEMGTIRYRQSPAGRKKGDRCSLICPGLLTDQPFISIYIELVYLILWRDVFDVVGQ